MSGITASNFICQWGRPCEVFGWLFKSATGRRLSSQRELGVCSTTWCFLRTWCCMAGGGKNNCDRRNVPLWAREYEDGSCATLLYLLVQLNFNKNGPTLAINQCISMHQHLILINVLMSVNEPTQIDAHSRINAYQLTIGSWIRYCFLDRLLIPC